MNRRIGTRLLAIVMALAMSVTMTACGSDTTKAKKVVENFFDAIADENVKDFKKCLDEDSLEDLEDAMDDDEIEDLLKDINDSAEDEQGKNWRKNVKITDVEEDEDLTEEMDDDRTYYVVTALMTYEDEDGDEQEDEQEMTVFEEDGKFYLDANTMGGF